MAARGAGAALPGIPHDRARALQHAFMAGIVDRQFLEETKAVGIDVSPVGAGFAPHDRVYVPSTARKVRFRPQTARLGRQLRDLACPSSPKPNRILDIQHRQAFMSRCIWRTSLVVVLEVLVPQIDHQSIHFRHPHQRIPLGQVGQRPPRSE